MLSYFLARVFTADLAGTPNSISPKSLDRHLRLVSVRETGRIEVMVGNAKNILAKFGATWQFLWLVFSVLAAPVLATEPDEPNQRRYSAAERHMGTQFELTAYACNESSAKHAFRAAFDRIAEIDQRLSNYKTDSELNQLCRSAPHQQPVPASADLCRVLSASLETHQQTNGAFDITLGQVTKLWRRARRRQQLPEPELLAEAMQTVGVDAIQVDAQANTVRIAKPNVQIDLGGIAKGHALDQALTAMADNGIQAAMVNGGGDIAVSRAPPGTSGWRVIILPLNADENPHGEKLPEPMTLVLSNQAVATSGDVFQFVEIDGRRYSHIIDPKTGTGLQRTSSVTVIAPTGMQADALASAVTVMGPSKSFSWLDTLDSVDAYFVWREPAEQLVRQRRSPGFNRYLGSLE
ncbi:MAG: FAD:protein FMN transferase [Pirellulaceae bacterium]